VCTTYLRHEFDLSAFPTFARRCRQAEVGCSDICPQLRSATTPFPGRASFCLVGACAPIRGMPTPRRASVGCMPKARACVAQDLVQAAHWSLKAAQQGNALAQVNLGIAYQNGEGVEQDFTEAAKWLRKAADQGNAHPQANLCWLYANGRGWRRTTRRPSCGRPWRSRGGGGRNSRARRQGSRYVSCQDDACSDRRGAAIGAPTVSEVMGSTRGCDPGSILSGGAGFPHRQH
jgi:hypothetical protein